MKIKTFITDPSSKKDRLIFLAVLLFLSACISGILSASVCKENDIFCSIFLSGGLAFRCGTETVSEILKNNFTGTFLLLVFLGFSGFSAFGQIFSVSVILYRGFCFGSAVFICMQNFGTKAPLVALIMIIPFGIFSSIIIFAAARESARNSNIIFRFLFLNREKEDMKKSVKMYFLRFLFLFIFTAAGIVIQTLLLYLTVKFII